jgi:hypothetical protein
MSLTTIPQKMHMSAVGCIKTHPATSGATVNEIKQKN